MHNLTKIKIFRILLWITYPLSLILLFPFASLKKKKKNNLFFFLDRYALGGAQRVYLDILESVKDVYKTVYFTRKSHNDTFKTTFAQFVNIECYDIHFWCDNLLLRLFAVHYFAFFLNRHGDAKILGSNSTFFYDMLPFLNRRIKKIELLHNFSFDKNGMEFFGLANHKYLHHRMVIDGATQQNIIDQYERYNINKAYNEKVSVVEYGVPLPARVIKPASPPLKVLYAGRGTPQKRIKLLNRVIEQFIANQAPVDFTIVGSMGDELTQNVISNSAVLGETGDREKMNALFAENHIIILVSAFEGFPVVVKEGMSYGCVPVVTALPGNKIHLQHLTNALLIEHPEDEAKVVEQAINHIEMLLHQPDLLARLSDNAYQYAQKNFGKEQFLAAYRNLLT